MRRHLGDEGQLGRKSLNVVRLFLDERVGDELGEVAVLVTRLLEPSVKEALQRLPDCVTVGADYHCAAHWAIVGKLCTLNQVEVPSEQGKQRLRSDGGGTNGIALCREGLVRTC